MIDADGDSTPGPVFLRPTLHSATWAATWVVVVAGAAIRFVRLRWTLFGDELWVIRFLQDGTYVRHIDPTPPLFFYAALLSSRLCGFHEACLRIPPFVFGVVLTLVPLGARRLLNPTTVFVWTLLLAFSSPFVFYSGRLKQYTLEAAVEALLIVLFYRAAKNFGSRPELRAFLAVAWIAVLMTHTAIFVLTATCAAFVLTCLLERRTHSVMLYGMGGHAIAAMLFAMAYLTFYRPIGLHADLDSYWSGAHRFFDGSWQFALEQTTSWLGQMLNLTRGFAIVATASFVFVLVRFRKSSQHLALISTGVMTPLTALAASYVHAYPYGEVRLMMFATPALFLVVAIAFAELVGLHRLFAVPLTLLLALFTYRQLDQDPYNSSYMRAWDLRRSYDYVREHHPAGVPIVAHEWDAAEIKYYVSRAVPDLVVLPANGTTANANAREVWVFTAASRPLRIEDPYRCSLLIADHDMRLERCLNVHTEPAHLTSALEGVRGATAATLSRSSGHP